MQLNDKVLTDHGEGVVVGWESFNRDGSSAGLSLEDTGNRVAVKLDDGHSWCFDGLYYEQAKHLKEVKHG
ncbi:hypothetical protein CNR37_00090 [Pseudomonas phage ventosus]|uniref:Uncharacterized protein n=1 Tax=Pseudomonas phage ventosus TaxID=2048980 RepID=A0A2H4P7Z5_9CAUD|nr:hypothetical protein CNR37_00090 [Pseudomonas phage ventosus]